jgi:hypothetical protein
MLILECSQGCYGRTDGRKEGQKDGGVTIFLRNFVGEGIISKYTCMSMFSKHHDELDMPQNRKNYNQEYS